MSLTANKFGDLLSNLDELSRHQTFQVMLHLRELEPEDVDATREVMASFNALSETGSIDVVKQIKQQFSNEDWRTIMELI